MSIDIPVIGRFLKSRQSLAQQVVDSGTLVDDPVALVDDAAALVGGQTAIDSGIIRDMSTDKPRSSIRKHR